MSGSKKKHVSINGFQFHDTTTQKQEATEFYDYYYHLKNFSFMWEHVPLELKYEITLSADQKNTNEKNNNG